jgi:exonuclease III
MITHKSNKIKSHFNYHYFFKHNKKFNYKSKWDLEWKNYIKNNKCEKLLYFICNDKNNKIKEIDIINKYYIIDCTDDTLDIINLNNNIFLKKFLKNE